jgi:hypothetical protein
MVIRNDSDHTFDLLAPTRRLAAICGPDMKPDGSLSYPLTAARFPFVDELLEGAGDFSVVPGRLLGPGARATTGTYYIYAAHYPPTAPHSAVFTCEGAIVATTDGSWSPASLTVEDRLVNIATRSVRIIPEQVTTTEPEATTSTAAVQTGTN